MFVTAKVQDCGHIICISTSKNEIKMKKRFFLMVLTIVVSIMQLDAQQTETNMKYRYIASCVFTRDYPELSLRIQDYLKERFGMEIIPEA